MSLAARASDADAGLRLADVCVAVGARPLFAAVSLRVAPGRATALMGPSGVGKSSLLAFLCGLTPPGMTGAGQVWVDGREVTNLAPESRRLGVLFQDDLLFPHMSVGDNLAFAAPRGLGRAQRRARVERALAEADLAGFAARDPATLSGGQKARAAVMRMLMAEPRALLLDEPFGRLDAPLRARFRAFVLAHARERGLPILLVTHDAEDASDLAANVMILSQGVA